MIIYPAIDLRGGKCVRLRQGDFDAETVFADDPLEAAERWLSEGAEWLHIVNLDGALGERGSENLAALARILRVAPKVQLGGGLRSVEDVARVLDMGVSRAILGTVAVRNPQVVSEALARYGAERVAVGIDARDGQVAVQGWQDVTSVSAVDLGMKMRALGVTQVVYTDVARDGMLMGVNVEATAKLALSTGLQVIASGGVASLEDIRAVRAREVDGVSGVIVGMALYRGAFTLKEALALAR